ncbi:MAG: OprD family outer membrane porin [Armatimonadota bacterium]
MNRTFGDGTIQQSTAIGAWLNYRSAQWNKLSFTLTGYTSQPFFNNLPQYGGANLLTRDQKGFAVLGRAFAEVELGKSKLRLYRQSMETPFINLNDVRMVPVTLEAYTCEGAASDKLNFMVSHVTKIKGWSMNGFQSMSAYAGYPGTDKPVTLAGVRFIPDDKYKFQLWNYVCYDYMNIVYFQGDAKWPVEKDTFLTLSAQYIDQHDIGQNPLAGKFSTGASGVLAGVLCNGLGVTLGHTSTQEGHDIVNPWGSYQGYASLIEEDCDLAGEKAWVAGISYDFRHIGLKNVSAFMNHSHAFLSRSGSVLDPRQNENNFTIDYRPDGDLWLRFRAAKVDSALDMNDLNISDCRIILNYSF